MPAHSLSLVPAAYVVLLRPLPGSELPEVLLQMRRNTGYMDGHWACGAAGHVDPGESVLEAAVREAREELGILIAPDDLEPLTAMHRSGDVGGAAVEQRVDFFLACRRWSGRPEVREAGRSAGLTWFPLTRLPERVPPHERAVLDGLASSLRQGPRLAAITVFGFDGGRLSPHHRGRRDHDPP